MNSRYLMIALLAAVPTIAAAETPAATPDAGSLSDKVMQDEPGTKGGSTADPTAKPQDNSLSAKVMNDAPGTKGGATGTPTAKPDAGLASKVTKDLTGKN